MGATAGQRHCPIHERDRLAGPGIVAFDACNDYRSTMEPCARPETTTLTIRNVDRRVRDQLRVRAARNGQSMEAELRQILHEALAGDRQQEVNLAEAIRRRMTPLGGVEFELPSRATVREPPRFE